MILYKNKYRIESARLKDWDYSRYGYYFVTICIKDKHCFFGNIMDNKMQLSEIGEIVAEEWQNTERVRDNVKLDEWVIMPNHLHGIIIIENDEETHSVRLYRKDNLSNVIRGFKSATIRNVHKRGFKDFVWQSRFYDHIIRNEQELHDIREYIVNNPSKWQFDEENIENISRDTK